MSGKPVSDEGIQAVLAFLPRLQEHRGKFGKSGVHKNEDGSFFIAAAYDGIVSEFNNALYEHHWVDPSCDWPAKAKMIQDGAAIRSATLEDIRTLFTIFTRAERFNEGIQLVFLRGGRVQAILERFQELTKQIPNHEAE
ncbi:MAG: DUF6508 domain-containing protein [Mariprofundaceae bacterium]